MTHGSFLTVIKTAAATSSAGLCGESPQETQQEQGRSILSIVKASCQKSLLVTDVCDFVSIYGYCIKSSLKIRKGRRTKLVIT